jgi:hypothetical protein
MSRLRDQWRCVLEQHRRLFGLTPRQQLYDFLLGVALAAVVLAQISALGLLPGVGQ